MNTSFFVRQKLNEFANSSRIELLLPLLHKNFKLSVYRSRVELLMSLIIQVAYNEQVFAMAGHSLNVQPGTNAD